MRKMVIGAWLVVACFGHAPIFINKDFTSASTQNKTLMKICVGSKEFTATLYTNATVDSFKALLPLTLEMAELNNNEKYNYLPVRLPTDAAIVGNIKEGDILLFGDHCLVLFYASFTTSHQYTRLGHIDNTRGLREALGSGGANVTMQLP